MVESVVNPGLDGFYLPIYSFHMVKRVFNISACVGYFLFFYHFESHLKRHFLFFPTFVDYDVSSVYIHVSQHFSCVWLRHCIRYLTEKTQGLVSYLNVVSLVAVLDIFQGFLCFIKLHSIRNYKQQDPLLKSYSHFFKTVIYRSAPFT